MASKRKILITTGDVDGIGWEVTAKALSSLGPKPNVQFFYYRHIKNQKPKLSTKFKHKIVTSLTQAYLLPFDPKTAVEVRSSSSPAHWVEEAATACLRGEFQALVTAPLSKTTILEAGFKDIGHTEILSRISSVRDLFMGFRGKKFSVVLATGHQPLSQAVQLFHPKLLMQAVQAAEQLRKVLPVAVRKKPMALVGLNPHAGESGLIGNEEAWMKGFISGLPKDVRLVGPLVPDAAFLPQNWGKYSVYICPYHDQGLIPFKMVHGFSGGVHLTLGLPFVRTSVDHGTAKDIFGKNKAQAGSMKDAILAAIQLSGEKTL